MLPTRGGTIRRAFTGLVVAAALASLAPADAATVVALAVPGSSRTGYATPVLVVAPGEPLLFVNTDNAALPHDLVAKDAKGPDSRSWCGDYPAGSCPLFWTRQLVFGESQFVMGLENARAGRAYEFLCTVHPRDMTGVLIVV